MRHQNDRLGRILLDLREEVVALALERLITDGKHLVEHKNVALGFDGHGERQSHLHTAGVILQLLVHEPVRRTRRYRHTWRRFRHG